MLPETALIEKLQLFRGWTYSARGARYPTPVPGVNVPLGDPPVTNCCAFIEGLILPVAGEHVVGLRWTWHRHRQMMVRTSDLYGPVTALVETELADPVPCTEVPPAWSVVQGWRCMDPLAGHTFVVARSSADRVLVLEANRAHGLDGVGWRSVGMLGSGLATPDEAWVRLRPGIVTWGGLRETYSAGMKVCRLRVDAGA